MNSLNTPHKDNVLSDIPSPNLPKLTGEKCTYD